jgi:hypothetical protein
MDFYTKLILTVIAAALSTIALENIVASKADAQTQPVISKVILCDAGNIERCLGITPDGKLPVVVFPDK